MDNSRTRSSDKPQSRKMKPPYSAKVRLSLVVIPLMATWIVGTAVKEGYTDKAVIPVPGDRWTKGFGDTQGEDGK